MGGDYPEGDRFGRSVSISEDTVVAGAPGDDNKGSAYMFENDQVWRFRGYTYLGQPTTNLLRTIAANSTPIDGVTLTLYGRGQNEPAPGTWQKVTQAGADGFIISTLCNPGCSTSSAWRWSRRRVWLCPASAQTPVKWWEITPLSGMAHRRRCISVNSTLMFPHPRRLQRQPRLIRQPRLTHQLHPNVHSNSDIYPSLPASLAAGLLSSVLHHPD